MRHRMRVGLRAFSRPGVAVLAACSIGLLLHACGGGGGGTGGVGGGGGPTNTPPRGGTPTGVPEPTATPIIVSGGDIATAAKDAPAGSIVVVPAGSYPAIVLQQGDLHGPITLMADITGALSGSIPGQAVIVAGSAP